MMGKGKKYVSLDKKDLEALIESYADKFYRVMTECEVGVATNSDVRDVVKKLAGFIKDYEELIAEEGEPVALGA